MKFSFFQLIFTKYIYSQNNQIFFLIFQLLTALILNVIQMISVLMAMQGYSWMYAEKLNSESSVSQTSLKEIEFQVAKSRHSEKKLKRTSKNEIISAFRSSFQNLSLRKQICISVI